MSLKFKKVTHCIFDCDGLLLDTEILYTAMTQNIIDRFGSPGSFYTWDIQSQMLGIPTVEEGNKLVEIFKLPITGDDYAQMTDEMIPKMMRNCRKCEGAEKLVRHLHQQNIPICVATSSSQKSFEGKTENHKEFFQLFSHVVVGSDDEVKNGKPSPDIFVIAAKRFKDSPKPENCLVFEDSPNGVAAARAAGMQVVMIPNPHIPQEQRKDATQVIDSLSKFKPEDFGLPKFSQ